MKKIMLIAASAALFAACSSEADFEQTMPSQAETNFTTGTDAVGFDVVAGKANTRATYGAITTDVLKTSSDGFGIFGFHGTAYAASLKPNYMYNQQVIYSGSDWTYDPIKYWPNETGSSSANSTHEEKLSFFAYAPFIKVTPATGDPVAYTAKALTSGEAPQGITAITNNTESSNDPTLTFVVPDDPAKQTDLLWGVIPATTTWTNVTSTTPVSMTEGEPWVDLLKPTVESKVKFQFKHALAKLNFLIDAYVDDDDTNTNPVAPKSKIYVREVSLIGCNIGKEGKLNLKNTTAGEPLWSDVKDMQSTPAALTTTSAYHLKDGLKTNAEVKLQNSGADLTTYYVKTVIVKNEIVGAGTGTTEDNHACVTTTIKDKYEFDADNGWSKTAGTPEVTYTPGSEGTTVTYWEDAPCTATQITWANVTAVNNVDNTEAAVLNGTIIQGGSGVTNTPVNLLKGGDDTSIMVIPYSVASNVHKIKIVYDVETSDSNLSDPLTNPLSTGNVVQNEIEKVLNFASFEAGKEYTIKIHLGMTSVKVDAEVTPWDTAGTSEDINLPHNND